MNVYVSRNMAGDPFVVVLPRLTFHHDRELHVALWKAYNNIEPRNSRGELI